jgi:hypothetical protein
MAFNDTYQIIMPMIRFRVIKIDKECKYLWNFPTTTL